MKTVQVFFVVVLGWSLVLLISSHSYLMMIMIISEQQQNGEKIVRGTGEQRDGRNRQISSPGSRLQDRGINMNWTRTSNATFSQTYGTLIIQVRGEMGNHLQKIAHGYGLLWYALELLQQQPPDDNISTVLQPTLKIQHAMHKNKWRKASADVQQCFVHLRQLDYESAHQSAFVKQKQRQERWIKKAQDHYQQMLDHITGEGLSSIQQGMKEWKQLQQLSSINLDLVKTKDESHNHSPFPMVTLGGPMRNALIDHFYNNYRSLFAWNKHGDGETCCKQLPDPDEVVLHFRNFAKELTVAEQTSRGFEELDPQRTVDLLLGHLKQGQKIAITTRFAHDPRVQRYVRAMSAHGFQVRLVTNQTGVQDFCFLLHAQQELIGVAKSTYARWASYLGLAQKVQLYALNNTGSKAFIANVMEYPWEHPEIVRRIQWPVFASNYQQQQQT